MIRSEPRSASSASGRINPCVSEIRPIRARAGNRGPVLVVGFKVSEPQSRTRSKTSVFRSLRRSLLAPLCGATAGHGPGSKPKRFSRSWTGCAGRGFLHSCLGLTRNPDQRLFCSYGGLGERQARTNSPWRVTFTGPDSRSGAASGVIGAGVLNFSNRLQYSGPVDSALSR